MKITEIEVHQISLPYEDWLAYPLRHYGAPSQRTIYVVHTDTELTGLGDGGKPVTDKVLDRYIGSNPFDLDGGRGQPASGHGDVRSDGQGSRRAGVQALGQKHRSWVPVSSWTVSTHPEHMAEAGASRGSGAANPVALGHRFHLRRRHTHVLPLRTGEIRTLPRVSRLEAGLGALQPLRADYDPLLGRRRSPRVPPDVRSPRAGGNDTGAIRGMTRRSGSKLLSPDIPSIMP